VQAFCCLILEDEIKLFAYLTIMPSRHTGDMDVKIHTFWTLALYGSE
jgi:hypothetical protein